MRQIAVYTALEGAETMKNLSIMIKPASSLCNMRCVYCFYADVAHQRDIASYGLISDDTLETMLRAIFADLKRGDHLNLAFQGGEPTLAGLNFFRSVIRKVSALNQGVHVHYALQTNGLLLDDEWCAFLHENRFLVGLSYDLLPNRNDEARVDVNEIIFKGLTVQGVYGRKMYETWYKMAAMIEGGLDLTPIITHRFHYTEFEKGFAAMNSGKSGKVILDWRNEP